MRCCYRFPSAPAQACFSTSEPAYLQSLGVFRTGHTRAKVTTMAFGKYLKWPIILVVAFSFLAVPGKSQCPAEYFQCNDTRHCILKSFLCDGYADCGDDEVDCPVCSSDGFFCDGRCIRKIYTCDGIHDCHDLMDELHCTETEVYDPYYGHSSRTIPAFHPNGTFECKDGSKRNAYVECDGRADCVDGTDESVTCYSREKCRGDTFFCDEGCLPSYRLCDGVRDCSSGRDERYCSKFIMNHVTPPVAANIPQTRFTLPPLKLTSRTTRTRSEVISTQTSVPTTDSYQLAEESSQSSTTAAPVATTQILVLYSLIAVVTVLLAMPLTFLVFKRFYKRGQPHQAPREVNFASLALAEE